jgi:hypothetical protein
MNVPPGTGVNVTVGGRGWVFGILVGIQSAISEDRRFAAEWGIRCEGNVLWRGFHASEAGAHDHWIVCPVLPTFCGRKHSSQPVSLCASMGMKETPCVMSVFARLAIFRPGIIVGNAHTPAWVGWLGSLVPGSFGNIDQRILGRSIAAEIALHSREAGEVTLRNAAMKKLAAQFNSVP